MTAKKRSDKKSQHRRSGRRRRGQLRPSFPGMDEKMSAVLLEFIEPYRQFATTDEALERLVALGIAAWNVSLLPEEKRDLMLTDLAVAVVSSRPSSVRRLAAKIHLPFFTPSREVAEFKQIVYELVERKLQHYALNRRFIVDYRFSQTADDLQLWVMSTLEPQGKG